jgi:hypothetical protein
MRKVQAVAISLILLLSACSTGSPSDPGVPTNPTDALLHSVADGVDFTYAAMQLLGALNRQGKVTAVQYDKAIEAWDRYRVAGKFILENPSDPSVPAKQQDMSSASTQIQSVLLEVAR